MSTAQDGSSRVTSAGGRARSGEKDRSITELRGLALLEVFAARWLSGRFLLRGNVVVLPVCGQMCAFRVCGGEHTWQQVVGNGGSNTLQRGATDSLRALGFEEVGGAHVVASALAVDSQTVVTLLPGVPEEGGEGEGRSININSRSRGTGMSGTGGNESQLRQAGMSDSKAGGSAMAEREGERGGVGGDEGGVGYAKRVAADLQGVSFGSVGGLEEQKAALREAVMLPLRHPELFER